MARPKATVTAAIEANMEHIARAEETARELIALRNQAANVYHCAGILAQKNLDLIEQLRQTNRELEGALRTPVAA